MDQTEPEQIAIAKQQTQDVGEYSEKKSGHECAQPISIYFHRLCQMGVGCDGFPLNAKLDRGKRFATEDHPADSMNQFMDNDAQHHCRDENDRVPGWL